MGIIRKFGWSGVSLCVSVVGFYLVWLATSTYGAGVSTDSINYLSSADHFAAGKGMFDYQNKPLLLWPPLYPFLLGVVKWSTGYSALSAGRLLNAIFFGAAIWMTGKILAVNFPMHPVWTLWGGLAMCSSVSILALSANIGTDILFTLLVLVFLWVAQRWSAAPKSNWLISLAVITAAMTVLRWTGAALILTDILIILIGLRHQPLRALRAAFISPRRR